MKTIFSFLAVAVLSVNVLTAQIRKIPAEVTDAFKAKFSNAEKVEWKDNLTYFTADFVLNGAEMTADFSTKGEWKETTKKMKFEELPEAVKDGFNKSKFNDWTPGSVTQIERKANDTQYKVYAEKSSIVQKRFLFFNSKGQLEREEPGI